MDEASAMDTADQGSDERGFVLIELLSALVILAALAGLVILGMDQITSGATAARDGADTDTCATAIAAYRLENDGSLPSVDTDLAPYVNGAAPDCLP